MLTDKPTETQTDISENNTTLIAWVEIINFKQLHGHDTDFCEQHNTPQPNYYFYFPFNQLVAQKSYSWLGLVLQK